ncbi:ATP-binding cassette sub-family C member 9-like isoform X4 [Octopus sinensis]|uniref:ATP-binding cassette sub-family C member 9-like isoform X4 n=1 Tax=Octopus sinensis TaxID=2607531 RepID=A0A7E6FMX8_9MOLL|nr:ATP-binding cassette sub-family C member 9-like isoform X4 [Octopus sinensis]
MTQQTPLNVTGPLITKTLPKQVVAAKKTYGFCGSRLDALSVANGVLQNDCFIDVLNIIPHCIFLLFSVPILIIWSKSVIGTKKVKTWVHFRVHAFRWVVTLFLIGVNLMEIAEGLTSDAHDPDSVNYHVFIPPCAALIGSVMSITYYHNVEIWNSPGFLLILLGYWSAAFVLRVFKLISLYRNNMDFTDLRLDLTWVVTVVYGILIFVEMDVLRVQKYAFFQEPCPVHSPEELAYLKYIQPYVSFLSKITFWWITDLIRKGFRHVIELHNLGKLPMTEKSTYNYKKIWISFENNKQSKLRLGLKPSLLVSMFKASWPAIIWSGCLRLTADLLAFIGPWWIEDILNYCNEFSQPIGSTSRHHNATSRVVSVTRRSLEDDVGAVYSIYNGSSTTTTAATTAIKTTVAALLPLQDKKDNLNVSVTEFFSNGYILITLVFVLMLLQYSLMEYHFFILIREGMRMKAAIQVMIYSKVQQLSTQALSHGRITETEIMNHVTLECNNLMIIYSFLHYFWAIPLQIVVGFIVVFLKLGSSAVVGFFIIAVHTCMHIATARHLFRLQGSIMNLSERRVKKVKQLIKGIKQIKLNAWEKCFSRLVCKDRKKEMKLLYRIAYLKSIIEFLVTSAPLLSTAATFLYYHISKETVLTPGQVFSVAATFQVMCYPFYFLCVIYISLLNAKSSSRELTSFLQSSQICQHPSAFFTKCHQTSNVQKDAELSFSMSRLRSVVQSAKSMFCCIDCKNKLDTLMKYDVKTNQLSMAFHNGAMRGSISSVESSPPLGHTPNHSRQNSGASVLDILDPAFRRPSFSQHSITSENDTYIAERRGFHYRRRNTNGNLSITEDEGETAEAAPTLEHRLALDITDASFSTDLSDESSCLKDINIKIPLGKMTIITGPSGSGKSTLLSAMLGEMVLDSGVMEWNRACTLAYCSQPPWLMNATVQENILFGQPYNYRKYKKVLHAVSLNTDLTLWPAKDRTEVGDQGILLTEGQKQRISLARALYSSANTIIMDDPFSKIEHHLGRNVFEEAVVRSMIRRKRTVILVSPQIPHIYNAYQIIVVNRHQIKCQGRLKDIKRADPDLYESWRRVLKDNKRTNVVERRSSLAERQDIDHELDKHRRTSFDHISEPVHKLSIQSNLGIPISRQVSQMSVMTENSLEDDGLEEDDLLPLDDYTTETCFEQDNEEEESPSLKLDLRDLGSISTGMCFEFLKLCSSSLVLLLVLLLLCKHTLIVTSDLWLANWMYSKHSVHYEIHQNNSITSPKHTPVNHTYYIGLYMVICLSCVAVTVLTGLLLKFTTVRGADRLHQKMLHYLTSLPVIHFESTPPATILNTFSADSRIVDQILPTTIELLLRFLLQAIIVLVICSIAMPYFVLATVPIIILFYLLFKFYRPSIRQLNRLQNLTKLPLFNHFSEILSGLRTIRAYRVQYWFTGYVTHAINVFNVVFLYIHAVNRWLAIRLDFLGCLILLLASLGSLAFSIQNEENGTLVGLCMLNVLMMPIYVNMIARHATELENNITSLERVVEYACETPPSVDPPDCIEVPESWPDVGDIEFQHIALNYDPEQSPVVMDATFTIKDAEKVAFCGHAGSGRSSLILSLFKMIHVHEGKILINYQDISVVPSQVLRSRLSIVPHDPIMFDGTVRFNLDPEGIYKDPEIWEALNAVQMKSTVQELPHKLETVVLHEGKEFTIGQRQLFCFARAYMRDSKIVIVEQEHTNDDALMEETIQDLIRTVFRDSTVLVTLHHLTHLNDYDRVMVLDQGRIVEFDKASELLMNENSMLAALVRESQLKRPNKVVITIS